MANSLKSKLILIVGSLTILILVPLFRSNFNAAVTYHRWKNLSWDDFQGFVKPFTGWGAGISSNVYVEYDSAVEKYVAYSAMNNQLSWKRASSVESSYVLNHEQYHFNITEYFARKLNQIIKNEGLNTEEKIVSELSSIRSQLAALQDKYDNDADHGIERDLQRNWEFQIDSLLKLFEPDSGFLVDYFTGATVLMPADFDTYLGINEDESVYRGFQLEKYDMLLAMTSFQYIDLAVESLTESLQQYYQDDSVLITRFDVDSMIFEYQAEVESYDSIALETTIHLWTYSDKYLFKITANFPGDSTISGYREIAETFVSSFEVRDVADYWINRFEVLDPDVLFTSTAPLVGDGKNDKDESSRCAVYSKFQQYGFHGKPIFRDDGSFLLPFDILEHEDSLVQEVMLLHNDKWYSYEQGDQDQIFFIPDENLGSKVLSIDFGYLLKQDSVDKCFTFYHQSLEINKDSWP